MDTRAESQRTESQRAEQGELPGALVIDRTVLEWRLDSEGDDRVPAATSYDIEVVHVCRQRNSSSLAAAGRRALGGSTRPIWWLGSRRGSWSGCRSATAPPM